MSADTSPDVLVVGLGPAGSRAAAAAARAGRAVLAIDRKREAGRPVQCAELVPALLANEIAGLGPLTCQRIEAMITFVEDAPGDVAPGFPGRMIDRDRFDAALVAEAQRAGAACRLGVRLERLDPDGATRLSDGRTVRPRVVIGADGPRSRVGRALGRVNPDLVETRQVTVPLRAPHRATDVWLSADLPGGYAWLFPKGTVANLGLGVAPHARVRLKPRLEALHRALVAEGRVGPEILGRTGGAIPVGGPLDPVATWGDVAVLLAGDAAGLTHPVTGAGIAAAVISGTLAGEAAAAWIEGRAEAPTEYAAELDDLFGGALARAVARRRELVAAGEGGEGPAPAALRRGWIAYPEYWGGTR